MNEELKPCPFCGKPGRLMRSPNQRRWRVVCDDPINCYNTPNLVGSRDEAIQWWNTRPIEDALRTEITRLNRALLEADEAGKASYAAGYSAGQAEIARLQQQINDINAAWRADRNGQRDGLGIDSDTVELASMETGVHLMHVEPGDTIVSTAPRNLDRTEIARVKHDMARMFPGNDRIVIMPGWRIETRPGNDPEPAGDRLVYEQHEADKARYDPALPADLLDPEILAE